MVEKLINKSHILPLYRTIHEIFNSYGFLFNSFKFVGSFFSFENPSAKTNYRCFLKVMTGKNSKFGVKCNSNCYQDEM